MPESFGARLRQQREARQINLAAIADETKIKLSLLDALERDDLSQWPSGIFRRAYMRTYAHMIGLDPDAVLREFLEAHPEPADVFAEAVVAADDPSRRHGPPTRLRNMMDSAIGSIVKLRRPPAVAPSPAAPGQPIVPDEMPPATPSLVHTASSARPETAFGAPYFPPIDTPVASPSLAMDVLNDDTVEVGIGPHAAAPAAPVQVAVEPVAVHEPAAIQPVEPPVVHLPIAVAPPPGPSIDLDGVAALCTSLGRVSSRNEVQRLLGDAACLLSASGLIVWLWDEIAEEIRPALSHGYSEKVLAQLPIVKQDADNPTAAAFRSGQVRELPGATHRSGALVVPMLSVEGCAGVLAIELQPGAQPTSIRAIATIIAAALTQLTLRSRPVEALPVERMAAVASFRAPSRPVRVRR